MPTYPYLTRSPRTTSTYSAEEMRRRAGVSEQHIKRMPADLYFGWRTIDGVEVALLTTEGAKAFWDNPHTNTPMRVVAKCPDCGKVVPASRINQHAIVHTGKKGGGRS